jgi:hypothetical protein
MQVGSRRRFAGWLGAGALLAGAFGVFAAAPAAAAASLAATPSTGLTHAQNISVTVTTTEATPANVFVAVQQCGNATSAGVALSAYTNADCTGGADFGTALQVIGFPAGGLAAGAHTVSLKMLETGIGTNGAKCIAVTTGVLPCIIKARTVLGSTDYTGAASFALTTPIAYATGSTTTTTAGPTTTTTAGPTTPTTAAPKALLSASPSTGLTDGQTSSVTVTSPAKTPAGVFIAVQQCGNATSAGVALSAYTNADCTGGADFGVALQVIGFPAGGVAAGAHTVPLKMLKSGIGTNGAKCIPVTTGVLPCIIKARTVQGSEDYTGTGGFTITAPIAYAGASAGTPGTTPTTATSSSAPVLALTPGSSTNATATKTPTLALTGSSVSTFWALAIAAGLLDLGYLSLSSTWTRRRRVLGPGRWR